MSPSGRGQRHVGDEIAAGLAGEVQRGVAVSTVEVVAPARATAACASRVTLRIVVSCASARSCRARRQPPAAAMTSSSSALAPVPSPHSCTHSTPSAGMPSRSATWASTPAAKFCTPCSAISCVLACDDLVQAAPAGADRADLFVRADRRRHRRKQLDAGQFGLGLVIVDVEIADGVDLGRVAGLAGAQDDAHVGQFQRFADVAHQVQAGVVLFHHHVEQDDGDIAFPARAGRAPGRPNRHARIPADGAACRGCPARRVVVEWTSSSSSMIITRHGVRVADGVAGGGRSSAKRIPDRRDRPGGGP